MTLLVSGAPIPKRKTNHRPPQSLKSRSMRCEARLGLSDRAAVATTAGLEFVYLDPTTPTSEVLPGLDAAQGVVVSGGRVVVFAGSEVRVYALELNAF